MSNPLSSASWIGRGIAAVLAGGFLAFVFVNLLIDNRPKGDIRKVEGYVPWSEETLKAVETLPVQDGGRIKPFSTYAGFTMLAMHGARSMKIEGETVKIKGKDRKIFKLTPTAWLMDSLFRPHLASEMPTFRIDNSDVLIAIGVTPRGRRDRYSYNDILPGREKLMELAESYKMIEAEKRDPVQQQAMSLEVQLRSYETLLGYFGFARTGVTLRGSGGEGAPDSRANISDVMRTAPQIQEELARTRGQGLPLNPKVQDLLQQVLDAANFSKFSLVLLPPSDPKDAEWKTAGVSIMNVISQETTEPEQAIKDIQALETVARYAGRDEGEFRDHLIKVRDDLVARAKARGEYGSVELEASYYRSDWFMNVLVIFLLGTISAIAMWFSGGRISRVLSWVIWTCAITGTLLCIVAIVQRCLIMGRAPVGNLYDTIIFIAPTVVILALIGELFTRLRLALGLAPILGTALIILARRYEVGDPKDHMAPLVAVLNSNFWLTTHVLTITFGYAAGLLSAFLSCAYVIMRGLGLDNGNDKIRRVLTRMVYGMICLTLFLSLVGTVLGGIWANDSWGRFWGWDPKENGALMIVIWSLAILHARVGGFIREWGLHLASLFTACVVAFSWWHVNFLGVGLHNYGFTAGKDTIWNFYGSMLLVMIFGIFCMLTEKPLKKSPSPVGKLSPTSA